MSVHGLCGRIATNHASGLTTIMSRMKAPSTMPSAVMQSKNTWRQRGGMAAQSESLQRKCSNASHCNGGARCPGTLANTSITPQHF